MRIIANNFKKVLAIIERKDTITARKIEKALKKHSKQILEGRGFVELTPKEVKVLNEDKEEIKRNPKKKKPIKQKLNPLAIRTIKLRGAGILKPHEWIGGNEFFQVKPKVNKFLERERHGQLRMELNPKKKKKKNPIKKHLVKGSKAAKDYMAKLRKMKK